jgi:hypothetical protein
VRLLAVIATYCIAHRDAKLSAHLYDALIHTPPRADYQALVSVVAHPVLALLAPAGALMNICGWRKIITRGETSHRTVTPLQSMQIRRTDSEPHPGFDFLLCLHDFFQVGRRHKNVREQWNSSHHQEDLRECLNLALKMGVMTPGERSALEAEPALIEGGCSMGVYPGDFVRATLEKVWPLYQEFARLHRGRFMRYDPVQRRCVAFLAERIETHFILKELRRRYSIPLPRELFGCLTACWEGPWEAGRI